MKLTQTIKEKIKLPVDISARFDEALKNVTQKVVPVAKDEVTKTVCETKDSIFLIATIAAVGFAALCPSKSVKTPSAAPGVDELARNIYMVYNEVHTTNNYYSKGDTP